MNAPIKTSDPLIAYYVSKRDSIIGSILGMFDEFTRLDPVAAIHGAMMDAPGSESQ